jgi:CheY-like chemotaxis protein
MPTCLLVEDNQIERNQIERIFSRIGKKAVLISVGTLTEAMAVIARGQVRLVLLDNSLPDGNGADFAMKISQNPELRHIPVAILSEWPTPFMYAKAERARVLSVLRKRDLNSSILKNLWEMTSEPQTDVPRFNAD